MKKKIGTKQTKRLRISVFRSNKYIYAQIIDDAKGITLVSSSDIKQKSIIKGSDEQSKQIASARLVGMELAKKAKAKKITTVWFDRGSYKYHGRIKSLAEGAREGGLQF